MPRVVDPESLSIWRRIALATWGNPSDPTAYGTLDYDCQDALAYLAALSERTGERVTLTHLLGKALGDGIAKVPEINRYVSRGRLVERDTVDVFFQVAIHDDDPDAAPTITREHGARGGKTDADLSGAKLRAVDATPLVDVARRLREGARSVRRRREGPGGGAAAKALARMPTALVDLATRSGGFLSYDLGLDLRALGIPFDAFGSGMVTNLGTYGIDEGYAALSSLSRVSIILALGAVRDAPSVHEGALAIRKRVTIGVAFDHRVFDGYHSGILARHLRAAVERPLETFGPLPPAKPAAS